MKTQKQTFGAIAGKHVFRVQTRATGATVAGGKTDFVLLLPASADAETVIAADELTTFFREATGITLPRVPDDGKFDGKCFALGETSVGRSVHADAATLGESGCVVATVGDSYVIKGGRYGVLYGVYDLLGVLFRYETFSARTIRIERNVTAVPMYDLRITDVPDFRFRSPGHAYVKYNDVLCRRFRMIDLETLIDGEDGPYHNNFNYVPPAKFAAAHPKWYSDDGSQMCYTAHGDAAECEALVQEASRAIIRFIKAHPDVPYIAFNHQDNFEWCTCPACSALKNKYDGANSASAALFLNRVRGEVQKWFNGEGKAYDCGQKLVFFAYHGTNKPPVKYDEKKDAFSLIDGEVALQGVIPWFAETNADYTVPLNRGEVNRPVALALRGWRHLSNEILFWTYGTNFENYLAPYPSFFASRETYRFAKAQGAGLIFDECQIDTAASTGWEELKGYLYAKLAWNTEADVETLTREFFEASYGAGAQRMRKVFDAYLRRAKRQIADGFCGWRSEFIDPIQTKFWDKDELIDWEREMTAALDEAGEIARRNIVLERASVRYLLCEVFADAFDAETLGRLRQNAADDLKESGIDRFNEKKTIDVLYQKWGM